MQRTTLAGVNDILNNQCRDQMIQSIYNLRQKNGKCESYSVKKIFISGLSNTSKLLWVTLIA